MGGGVPLLGVYLTTQGVKLHALKGGAYGALAGQPERLLVDESAPRTDVGDDQGDTHGHDKHDHKNQFNDRCSHLIHKISSSFLRVKLPALKGGASRNGNFLLYCAP